PPVSWTLILLSKKREAVQFSDLPPGLLRTRPDAQKRAPSSRLAACASHKTFCASREAPLF
ncbi:hypothetical protein, partial [Rothia mucilaginosa]|uniref:hypothetical protein n=1 Tax=Rothia mucilaginosa TaxID=43675 RepID=UPI0028EE8661